MPALYDDEENIRPMESVVPPLKLKMKPIVMQGYNDDEAPVPQCTPRNRLLQMRRQAKDIEEEDIACATPRMSGGTGTAGPATERACQPGERWVQRWGKKLGGQYAIITAFVHHETRRLRFDVHLTSKCLRFSLVCTHQAMLEPACGDDDRLLVEMVKGIAMGLEFDKSTGQIMFGPSVPAAWVSSTGR